MNDFFQVQISKCSKCPVKTRSSIKTLKQIKNYKLVRGTGEILIVLEMYEFPDKIRKFENILQRKGIKNYTIVVGLECQTRSFELPSPIYESYCNCSTIDWNDFNYKAVITVNRGINAITQCDDIVGWNEFEEYLFNPTYFYTPFEFNKKHGKKIRVYPLPGFFEFLEDVDNFESFFVQFQLEQVKKYLDMETETFEAPVLHKVEDTDSFFNEFYKEPSFAIDTETNSLDHFKEDFRIGCTTISFDGREGYYLPFENIKKRRLSEFLKGKHQVYAEGKYDCKCFERVGVENAVVCDDIPLLFHMLNTDRKRNSIKSLAWCVGYGGYEKPLDEYKKKYPETKNDYLKIPEHILMPYATIDPILTKILEKKGKQLSRKQPGIYNLYREVILPVLPVFQAMEMEGVEIDFDYLNKLNIDLNVRLEGIKSKICEKLGDEDFQIGSGEKLGKALEKMGLPELGRTKKGYYQTNEKILEDWKKQGYDIAEDILEFRKLSKLINTYVGEVKDEEDIDFFDEDSDSGIVKHIRSDKKLHPVFRPGGTSSLRASSHDPNAQNFSKHGEGGKLFRPVLKCPDDYWIWEIDYSGFQLRIAAIVSGDENMIDVFLNSGGDLHSSTAAKIFHKDMSLEEFLKVKHLSPYKESRQKAKNEINFPLLFSDNAYVIYETIKQNWSEEEIFKYIEENDLEIMIDSYGNSDLVLTIITDIRKSFMGAYPKLEKWINNQHELARRGYVNTIMGGRRHLPRLAHQNVIDKKVKRNLNNISANSPIQSFEALTVYKSMVRLDKAIKLDAKMNMMIHDSMSGLVRKSHTKEFYDIAIPACQDLDTYSIPLLVDMSLGTVLGFGEEVNDRNIDKFVV